MMSQELDLVLNRAIKKANDLHHEYITLEGVLWSLLVEESVLRVLENCGVNVDNIKNDLNDFFQDKENFSILSVEEIEELGKIQFVDEGIREIAQENGIKYQPEVSLALQRVIQRAALHVQSSRKKEINAINILVALFQEKESFAVYLLEKYGAKRFDVIKIIAHEQDKAVNTESEEIEEELEREEEFQEEIPQKKKKKKSALMDYTTNLNELAKKSGTIFLTILYAIPSAIAVFPTPASPTRMGLFFLLLHNI